MLAKDPLPRLLSNRDALALVVANPRTSDTRRRWAKRTLAATQAEIARREQATMPAVEAHTAPSTNLGASTNG